MRSSRVVCLFNKIFKKKVRKISLPVRVYDAILFNFENEKRVDIVTAIEVYDTVDVNMMVYNTTTFGLINSNSVERNLGTVK